MARAVTRPAACSFNGKGKIICGESRGKEEVIPLAECVADVRNHLKSCHLSRAKVKEYELILARVGKFNLPLDEIKKLTICPKHLHNLGRYWRPLKTYQYPNYDGRKIALHCKNIVDWQVAQEIQTMFITLVQVGSRIRKYFFFLSPCHESSFHNKKRKRKRTSMLKYELDEIFCHVNQFLFQQYSRMSSRPANSHDFTVRFTVWGIHSRSHDLAFKSHGESENLEIAKQFR